MFSLVSLDPFHHPVTPSSRSSSRRTLTLLDHISRTNGYQRYFIPLVRTVGYASLSPPRAISLGLDAAPTNVNGESYALITTYHIRPPPVVMDVICEWNDGSIRHIVSFSYSLVRSDPISPRQPSSLLLSV